MIVTALQSFDHGRAIKRGETLTVSGAIAKQLKDKGLVSLDGLEDDTPTPAGGAALSSASPPARLSPKPTVKKSAAGAKPVAKKAKAKKSAK